MNYCKNCGVQLQNEVAFCPNCGVPQSDPTANQTAWQPGSAASPPPYAAPSAPPQTAYAAQGSYTAPNAPPQAPYSAQGPYATPNAPPQAPYAAQGPYAAPNAPPQAAYAAQGPYSAAQDAEQNKVMGILAYIIVLIPILAAPKESPYCRFHNNQGLILLLLAIGLGIANTIISMILFAISWRLALSLGTILHLTYLIIPVFCVIGIINANKGELKELPIIGKFRIIK